MKLEIKQNILMEHLNYVIKGISSKNIIPVLNCIKFELTNEGFPYNQSSIKVLDENEEEVILIADWYGVSPEEEDEVLEEIGGGFYTPWREI